MNSKKWKELVLIAVKDLADKNDQRLSWFPNDQGLAGHPDEYISHLINDRLFDDFLDSEDVGLTVSQKLAGYQLNYMFDRYWEKYPDDVDVYKIIDDPTWDGIRSAANDFLEIMEE